MCQFSVLQTVAGESGFPPLERFGLYLKTGLQGGGNFKR